MSSSPAKKRRKNDFAPSKKPVRSLDYFFNRQNEARQAKEDETVQSGASTAEDDAGQTEHIGLTDEELARKLQDEWDREAQAEAETEAQAEAQSSNGQVAVNNTMNGVLSAQDANANAQISSGPPRQDDNIPSDAPKTHTSLASSMPASLFPTKKTLTLQSTAADEDAITNAIPFDTSPLSFNPSDHIPKLQAAWAAEGGHATYALLTRCFVLVNSTQSRIKIVDTLVNLLRVLIEADPESLLPAVWLATNSISPPYISLELGLGGSAISKALKKVCGLDNASLRALSNKHGDAGDVAFEAKKKQSFTLRKPKPLTIKGVFDLLVKIANSKGTGSVEAKQRLVERLVQDARGAEESRYIVRTLVQHLRIGAVKTTMLIALSRAFLLSRPPNAAFPNRDVDSLSTLKKEELTEIYARNEEIVKACFARRPNYNDLIPVLLDIGVCDELLVRCGLALHIPLRPMLGSITRDLGEMLTKLQGRDFSCEWKYDGQRAQVHCDDKGRVTIFSRHLELMTDKYPDLVSLVPKIRGEGVNSFILEGEVVAVDQDTGDLKTFQTLSNRARKDVVIGSVKIDVCLFAFDLMYLNGEELLGRSFRERRDLLRSLFIEIPQRFTWVKSIDATSADAETVLDFFTSATENKCEGIMVKVLDNPVMEGAAEDAWGGDQPPTPLTPRKRRKPARAAAAEAAHENEKASSRRKALLSTYEPDKRLDSWLKVKKDYNASADTLDLIPIAAWHGMGRKSKWWSPILLAIRNAETGSLEAVTKCMSGFSDKFYTANRAKYNPDSNDAGESDEEDNKDAVDIPSNTLSSKPSYIDYSGPEPAVWFEPQEVWECAFADITLSPTYTAAIGLVSEERGLSLRFPRFLKVREDKGIEEASEAGFLAELYRKQEAQAPTTQKPRDADDDEEVE